MEYSLWEQGRASNGLFASMRPHHCPGGSSAVLGPIGLGLDAISAVAKFGIWYEMHKMNDLAVTQFEERRLTWLSQVIDQWVAEHRQGNGIKLDVTSAVSREVGKLIEKLTDLEKLDAPQVLLLRAARLADYMDEMSFVWAGVLQLLVLSSSSDPQWQFVPTTSTSTVEMIFSELRAGAGNAADAWWRGVFGVAAMFIPVVGPGIGGGLLGGAIGAGLDRKTKLAKLTRLEAYPELLRLGVAADQLLHLAARSTAFLNDQQLPMGAALYAVSMTREEAQLVLAQDSGQSWLGRLFSPKPRLQLKPLRAPDKAAC
jgi:hypothetical protein